MFMVFTAMNRYCSFVHIILVALLYAAALSVCSATQMEVSTTTADSVIRNTRNVVVIDVRTPEEFIIGHLPRAKNIDFYDVAFIDSLALLPKDATIVVYSRAGNRSTEAALILESLGYSRTFNMLAGFLAWKNEGRPVAKGK